MTDIASVAAAPSATSQRAGADRAQGDGDGFSAILRGGDDAGRGAGDQRRADSADAERDDAGEPEGHGRPARRLTDLAGLAMLLDARRSTDGDADANTDQENDVDRDDRGKDAGADEDAIAAAVPLAALATPREPRMSAAKEPPLGARGARGEGTEAANVGADPSRPAGAASDARDDGAAKEARGPSGAQQIRIAIVAETSITAPALMQDSRTVANLANAMAGDTDWRAAAEALKSLANDAETKPPAPVRDLRIQLRPADLGEVNARLSIRDDQLMVEIKVDGAEAYHRLSADRDKLAASLRALGFKVDEVTILQQPATTPQGQPTAGGRQEGASAGLHQGPGKGHGEQAGAGGGRRGEAGDGRGNGDARTRDSGAAAGGIYI